MATDKIFVEGRSEVEIIAAINLGTKMILQSVSPGDLDKIGKTLKELAIAISQAEEGKIPFGSVIESIHRAQKEELSRRLTVGDHSSSSSF